MAITSVAEPPPSSAAYSVEEGALRALWNLLNACGGEIPFEFIRHVKHVGFNVASQDSDAVHFPTPLKEQDATLAIKALEACATAAIADLRYGSEVQGSRDIAVDLDRASCFLMSAYLTTIDGMGKAHPLVKSKVPDTDLNQAQSILYRRLSANLYETKNPGEYYHIHGSLDATKTLEMIGLPAFNPKMIDYRTCINTIENAVKEFTSAELDEMNVRTSQAGIPALTWDHFLATPHGSALSQLPPLSVTETETSTHLLRLTTPIHFSGPRHALRGIKVIEMCRVIAGPTIGRSLAAHGATVLKVTSPNLPDVPFFQVDVNTGKHTTSLDLRNESDRAILDDLLADADVLVDGYRPGALARLGYGQEALTRLAESRSRGFVYVAEDCFGGTDEPGSATEWAGRRGWQQIADCVTGVAWAQGKFMGLNEPVVPPFPMSDYGTGALGCVAAMSALYRRAKYGGSYVCRTSLCQYDIFVMKLGLLPAAEQERLRKEHNPDFFELRHSDSVDEVGRRALTSRKRTAPHLFDEELMHAEWSVGFDGVVAWPKEAIAIGGLRVGHVRPARPNGFDKPSWLCWEESEGEQVTDSDGEQTEDSEEEI